MDKVKRKVTLFCYGIFLGLWLLHGLFSFAYDRLQPTVFLQVDQAELSGLEPVRDGVWVTVNGDPKMVYKDIITPVRRAVLHVHFDRIPGEVDLYFTRGQGEEFSSRNRVWGQMQEDGTYEFELFPGQVQSLRVDPGNIAGMEAEIKGVELNPKQPFKAYFRLTLYLLVMAVVVPALASCVICTIIETIHKNDKSAPQRQGIEGKSHGK